MKITNRQVDRLLEITENMEFSFSSIMAKRITYKLKLRDNKTVYFSTLISNMEQIDLREKASPWRLIGPLTNSYYFELYTDKKREENEEYLPCSLETLKNDFTKEYSPIKEALLTYGLK